MSPLADVYLSRKLNDFKWTVKLDPKYLVVSSGAQFQRRFLGILERFLGILERFLGILRDSWRFLGFLGFLRDSWGFSRDSQDS
jgi:hypothetical protein